MLSPGDMWRPDDGDGQEPDWVKTEREQFSTVRDKDKDNKWVILQKTSSIIVCSIGVRNRFVQPTTDLVSHEV